MSSQKTIRILYCVRFRKKRDILSPTALDKKLESQISGLKKAGCAVVLNETGFSKTYFIDRIVSFINEWKFIHNATKNDIIYVRGPFDYLLDLMLFSSKRCKYVYEAQDIEEFVYSRKMKSGDIISRIFSLYIYIPNKLFDRYLKKQMRGIVSVTNDVSSYNQTQTDNKCKYLTLGNGINCATQAIRCCPPCNDKYDILCVANVQPWHGIDRFICGLNDYQLTHKNQSKHIVLHVVGQGSEIPHLKNLVNNFNLEDNVIFHGYKSGKELDEMFDMCHIALGSLGGFRINMHEMSSLKSGEYCARGMPFVIAAKAVDFPDDWPYILHVPETEDSINMDDVIMFANRVMADTNHPQIMREYAEQNLDWSIKMKKLKEFLESL